MEKDNLVEFPGVEETPREDRGVPSLEEQEELDRVARLKQEQEYQEWLQDYEERKKNIGIAHIEDDIMWVDVMIKDTLVRLRMGLDFPDI